MDGCMFVVSKLPSPCLKQYAKSTGVEETQFTSKLLLDGLEKVERNGRK